MQQAVYDAIVIGAGPAGASCAVWLAHMGFSPLIIESSGRAGGLSASNPFEDTWNVTAPGLTGEEVAARIKQSLDSARVPVLLNSLVTRIERGDTPDGTGREVFKVFFGADLPLHARFVVIASGVEPRTPPDWERDHYDDVLVGPGKHVANYEFALKNVAVLGGGDNAFENALFLKERGAKSVHIYARTLRCQRHWMKFLNESDVTTGAYTFDPETRQVNGRPYDAVVVLYGFRARLQGMEDLGLDCNELGYIRTDFQTTQTNLPGIYAIGEVTHRQHPCVVTSMADGVVAAKAIQKELEKDGA
ncbi:thioredoxin reductase [Advenella kashmirensis W13003]|uniref:Thioredoxin reductase n=1 Tax=Advenella kashmirensis W13003 TaxID=1424334 RepID=V8QZ00_9BURK|nr:NAD(P)/FAD-dependent oxidoreductase [Advenella kashmirensis]ETF04249.1 thioredoxin reductase [Advenella kashmirensis W13003]